MAKIPQSSFDFKCKKLRPRMKKAEKDFIRGYACCLANAIKLEDWRYSQIGGGISLIDMKLAGVDDDDFKIIRSAQKIGN